MVPPCSPFILSPPMNSSSDSPDIVFNARYQREATVIPPSDHPLRENDIDREALKVLYRLRDAGFSGYLVGGGVRDLYLGRKPKDFDISTDARPGQLRRLFRNSRTIGRRFRLVQVFFRGNKIIEVSTLRSQSEFDLKDDSTVLPHNNTFGTLEEDAFRRDLTINSLFYEIENNTIIDFVGGVQDLDQGIIRVVGDPDRRFTRDPVRMLRAVRHAARTGFTIEDGTLAAIKEHGDKLSLCPSSRIRDELLKDLGSGACRPWAELCLETSLWEILVPVYSKQLSGTHGEAVREELLNILGVIDRLYLSAVKKGKVVIPDGMLFALLLLPWICRKYNIPEIPPRGQKYHSISRRIRADLDQYIGEHLNIKRMTREAMTSLVVNLATFHHCSKEKGLPKWLKRKSYYRDCSRFYGIFREARGLGQVKAELFVDPVKEGDVPGKGANGGGKSRSRGRGRVSPAFSSREQGVFGLRRRHKKK